MTVAFDIIGDVHGCIHELRSLLHVLGYSIPEGHPDGRQVIFAGDLVNRGPDTPAVLRLIQAMVKAGSAQSVMGNHDQKLLDFWTGKAEPGEELKESLMQFEQESTESREQAFQFLLSLPAYLKLDHNKLIVAHAGLSESLQKEDSEEARDFAINGPTTNEVDEHGKPIRYKWADHYRGEAYVVYGHTPSREPKWMNRTINIDTGCVYGGKLTALSYPEMRLTSVKAERVYFHRKKSM
jgi:protein phosphatase